MESGRYGKASWIKRHIGVALWRDMKDVSVGGGTLKNALWVTFKYL
jgi:hypothetical protein